ncbi:MAG: hypothetical protein JSR45_15370 [Proteobacteria bacterium]|nr:hypothetical protein [Pseudomonadota bacterium]
MRRSLALGSALAGAAAFLPKAWTQAWGAMALLAVLLCAPVWAPLLGLRGVWLCPVLCLVITLVALVSSAALFRVGVTDSAQAARKLGLGVGGLQFGAAELRLLASGLLVAGFLGLVAGALGLVLLFLATALDTPLLVLADQAALRRAWATQDGSVLGLAGAALVGALVMAALAVKLSLAKPATVAERRIVSVGALNLADGQFWALLAGLVVTSAPTIALAYACHSKWPLMAGNHTTFSLVAGLVTALLQVPLSIGFLSKAYKRLEYGPNGSRGG